MKGTPAEPQCGFSRAVVQILDLQGVSSDKMQTYNVLADPELRSGIKEFSCVLSFIDNTYWPKSVAQRMADNSSGLRERKFCWGV